MVSCARYCLAVCVLTVLLYVRKQHDHVFTALILDSPTVHSLLLAVRRFVFLGLKTFLFDSVYTGTRIRIDSVMRPRSSSATVSYSYVPSVLYADPLTLCARILQAAA